MISETKLKMFDNSNEVSRWFSQGGDEKFRYNYNLNNNSVVFDVGGYEGRWSDKINSLYKPKLFVFEPVKKYFQIIEKKFMGFDNVKVFNFGLSNKNYKVEINLLNDGSSLFSESEEKEEVVMRDILEFIEENEISDISLLKLNIEGSEYDLLDYLLKKNKQKNIKNLQIQFHNFIENSISRRENIRYVLSKTHKETYCFDFVWENWELL